MASIQPLAPGVAEELRASLVVSSLDQCATELVQNSIDANASAIEIKVDVAGHSLQVSDNGNGITAPDMERIGMRYATSKCSTLQDLRHIHTYGFRGEAIAAITEMSLVDIVSRPQNQEQLYSTIFKGGERLFCGRSSKQPRYNHGTTVSVRDLFYKFPVRQRYWSEASTSKLELELDKVRRAVETLALVCPSILFTVIDMVKDSKVLVCRKVDSQLHRITAVLGQSLSSSLTYITSDARETTYRLFGYVSMVGHYNRLYQFIFLNGRPIISESLQRAVTQVFQQSTFSKDSVQLDEDTRRSRERYPVFVLNLACPTTSYDICVDPSKVTVEFEEEERVIYVVRDTIIAFLERQHLLSRSAAEVLRNQTTTRKRKSRAGSAIGFSEATLPTGHGSHGKTSRPSKTSKSSQHEDDVQDEIDLEDEIEFELDSDWMSSMLDDDFVSSEVEYRRHDDSGIMLPSSDKRAVSMRITLPHACGPRPRHFSTGTSGIWAQDALRKWVNPVFPSSPIDIPTLQTLSLDSALGTGDGVRGEPIAKSISRFFALDGLTGHQNSIDRKRLQLSKSCLQHARVIAQLDRKFILCTMKASITADQDGARPRVLVVIDQHAADERVRVERLMKEMCSCSCSTLLSHSGNLESENGSLHHAHRLDSMDMIPPLSITLSKREWRLASQYSAWLSRWGIVLDDNGYSTKNGMQNNEHLAEDVDMGETDVDTVTVSHHFERSGGSSLGGRVDSTSQLSSQHPEQPRTRASTQPSTLDHSKGWITALPRVVADRCVVDGTLTQDLVRDTISWGEETRYSGRNSLNDDDHDDTADSKSWLRCIRGCPRGILDIVNSKACRGAIMFNDELSVEQCRQVVYNLAECSFPFQCAHGRPSVVPLTILDQDDQQSHRQRHPRRERESHWIGENLESFRR